MKIIILNINDNKLTIIMATTSSKIFESSVALNNSSMVSKIRYNREYLISSQTASELNTYLSFSPFATFNDAYESKYDMSKGKDGDNRHEEIDLDSKRIGAPGVRSIFNKAGAVMIGGNIAVKNGHNPEATKQIILGEASDWRVSNNVPLMDNRKTRLAISNASKCTVKDLVESSQKGILGKETYSFADFMYCKYLGRVSNNYLITLRRFPYPVDDYISSMGVDEGVRREYSSKNSESMGCLITWLGTPGNDMSNILKYTVSMPFKEFSAELQDQNVGADSQNSPANAIASMMDPTYRQEYMEGGAGKGVSDYMGKFFGSSDPPYPASQYKYYKDQSKVYGPVDVIKKVYGRSEDGISFDQSMTLTFDYELRSYNGINGRQAMLDLLANILNVTYTTGTFWGGGYRAAAAHQNNIFANMQIYKTKGGLTSFIDAFSNDLQTIKSAGKASIEKNGGMIKNFAKLANEFGGMLVAGVLNAFGRPAKQAFNSLLSPAPVGFWHVTIGNPHHPIMSLGNMILKSTTIEHYGPLGLDDFPTGIRVTCELTRGKPRDIRDIEKIYMKGNDRIYSPMGPKIFDMYKHSKEYINKSKTGISVIGDADATPQVAGENISVNISNIGEMKEVLQKYFGHADTNTILITSMEQDMGAHGKTKKGTAGGDSTLQGNK